MADMNCDGQVTSADISAFTLAMTNPEQYAITYEDCLLALGDLNGDGYVTAADITLFTQMMGAASGNAKRFAYDEENRLVSVSTLDDTPLHEYLYDALGRRIRRTITRRRRRCRRGTSTGPGSRCWRSTSRPIIGRPKSSHASSCGAPDCIVRRPTPPSAKVCVAPDCIRCAD
jgi:YD repeat-containing protein